MWGGRHNLATAPLRKISSLPPSPPFFLSHSLLSWPEHGWSIFFFFSEEDKTGYSFQRGIGLKKKGKQKVKGNNTQEARTAWFSVSPGVPSA